MIVHELWTQGCINLDEYKAKFFIGIWGYINIQKYWYKAYVGLIYTNIIHKAKNKCMRLVWVMLR